MIPLYPRRKLLSAGTNALFMNPLSPRAWNSTVKGLLFAHDGLLIWARNKFEWKSFEIALKEQFARIEENTNERNEQGETQQGSNRLKRRENAEENYKRITQMRGVIASSSSAKDWLQIRRKRKDRRKNFLLEQICPVCIYRFVYSARDDVALDMTTR